MVFVRTKGCRKPRRSCIHYPYNTGSFVNQENPNIRRGCSRIIIGLPSFDTGPQNPVFQPLLDGATVRGTRVGPVAPGGREDLVSTSASFPRVNPYWEIDKRFSAWLHRSQPAYHLRFTGLHGTRRHPPATAWRCFMSSK